MQACNTEISMTAKATGTDGVSGFVGYSSSGGASGNACFLDVTGDLGCSICFPILGECTFEVARGVVLVNGNC